MEMFERSQQPILDRWSQGLLTEEEFLKEVQWETTWGMDYELYQGILDEAKSHHLKVLGLNVPRDLVKEGGSRMESRSSPPKIKRGFRKWTSRINNIAPILPPSIKVIEKGSAKDFENFYEAQCLWDEGMAESLF